MPTGYTAGIIDGTTKTFEDFATLCMRAFGATIHMRDDSLEKSYEPRVPSAFYQENVDKANRLMSEASSMSDEEIVSTRKELLLKDKEYHENRIGEELKNKEVMQSMLKDAKAYTPPTSEHTGIKEFMIQQLEDTIKFDCDSSYHENALERINEELQTLNPAVVRADMLAKAQKYLDYYTKSLNEEIERCDNANKWVEDYIKSLKQ